MLALAAVIPLALATIASAQDATAIAAEKAHLTQSGIEPACIPSFEPKGTLNITFAGTVGTISMGQKITVADTQPTPKLLIKSADSGKPSPVLASQFTIAMIDCDVVGADNAQVTRHWLINNAKSSGSRDLPDGNDISTDDSVNVITNYGAPLPAEGSGSHRYVIVLYVQPEGFTPPASPANSSPIEKFSLSDYVKDAKLGDPFAANYFQVEQGTATASVSQTQPVGSSSVAANSSGSASGTKTGTSSTASSTSSNSALSVAAGYTLTAFSAVFGLFVTLF